MQSHKDVLRTLAGNIHLPSRLIQNRNCSQLATCRRKFWRLRTGAYHRETWAHRLGRHPFLAPTVPHGLVAIVRVPFDKRRRGKRLKIDLGSLYMRMPTCTIVQACAQPNCTIHFVCPHNKDIARNADARNQGASRVALVRRRLAAVAADHVSPVAARAPDGLVAGHRRRPPVPGGQHPATCVKISAVCVCGAMVVRSYLPFKRSANAELGRL